MRNLAMVGGCAVGKLNCSPSWPAETVLIKPKPPSTRRARIHNAACPLMVDGSISAGTTSDRITPVPVKSSGAVLLELGSFVWDSKLPHSRPFQYSQLTVCCKNFDATLPL